MLGIHLQLSQHKLPLELLNVNHALLKAFDLVPLLLLLLVDICKAILQQRSGLKLDFVDPL